MPETVRLAIFAAGLAVALIGGYGLGSVVGVGRDATAVVNGGAETEAHHHVPEADAGEYEVAGLAVSASGFTLVPGASVVPAGERQEWWFQIIGPDRAPVTEYATAADRHMRLILLRRDLTGYQHLHPTMDEDGTWRVQLSLPEPGVWRAYADFTAVGPAGSGAAVALGVDLTVAGDFTPAPLSPPTPVVQVGDLSVTYDGALAPGTTQPLRFRVSGPDGPVEVEPYLGANGQLVIIRDGDLGYVHVRPDAALADGGAVRFRAAAPSPGTYRMFFDFQVAGEVRTAEFTVEVT